MRKISFPAGREYSAVICLNANLPTKDIFELVSGIPVIVADGAAIQLIDMGIEPTLVIGDMDSFALAPHHADIDKSKLLVIPDQETNDFEKILLYCLRKNLKDLLILGFHGGELEHTLNNWSVFKKYSRRLNMCIFDKNRYGIPINESIEIYVNVNEIISLLPQPKVKLTTKNLEWELKNEELELGVREGARNVAIAEQVVLELHEGELLLFINQRLPIPPVFSREG